MDACWLRGAVVAPCPEGLAERVTAVLDAGRACYSTALFRRGAVVWADRHARRLARDAAAVGLGEVDRAEVERALAELGTAAFGDGEGIVRVAALDDGGPTPELVAECRDLGSDPPVWTAKVADFAHTPSGPWTGAKGANHALYARARGQMAALGLDEVLLADAEGFLVEGCRSNLFVVDAAGELVAPNLSRGAVAGLAQEIVHEKEKVVVRDFSLRELPSAREVVAVNAVRHACAVVRIDERPVGDEREGPWCRRLREGLAAET